MPHTLRPCKPTHKSATLRLCTAHCTNCFLLLHGAAVVLKRGPPSALSNCSLAPMRLCCPHPADCILLPTRKTTNSLLFTALMVRAHYLFQRARQTSSGDRAVPVMRGGATFELQRCTCGTKWREERLRTDGQMCTQFVWTTLLRLVKNLCPPTNVPFVSSNKAITTICPHQFLQVQTKESPSSLGCRPTWTAALLRLSSISFSSSLGQESGPSHSLCGRPFGL